MKIIYKEGKGEIEEKKSRFIAHVYPVQSEEQAVSYINEVKKKYWDARHNCYAYVLGEDAGFQRFSDDGEPQGTAGKPILDIIMKSGIYNCLIIVTRYFGGTLLGTGGLISLIRQLPRKDWNTAPCFRYRTGFWHRLMRIITALGKSSIFVRKRT